MPTDVAGVVLAGGKSTRLGEDKALLTLHPHFSQTLLERTVALLTPFVNTVWVSGRPGHLTRLFAAREQRGSAACVTAFQNMHGRFETTVAIYEQAALPYLQQAVKRKEYALHRAVPPERWSGVFYNAAEGSAFLNLNTPDDLAQARLLLESLVID